MPKVSELLSEVDISYRNSYSQEQKLKWMDTVQRQIYQVIPKESIPWEFFTFANMAFYDLPEDCDRFGIKEISIETKAGSNKFEVIPYLGITSNQSIGDHTRFYTVLEQKLMINPIPTVDDQGKRVFILYTHRPQEINQDSLDMIPELEEDFQELLILGTLERIARARGEIEDKNNFASDYNVLLAQYKELYKVTEPEYYRMNDVLPRSKGLRRSNWAVR